MLVSLTASLQFRAAILKPLARRGRFTTTWAAICFSRFLRLVFFGLQPTGRIEELQGKTKMYLRGNYFTALVKATFKARLLLQFSKLRLALLWSKFVN